jgi:RNA polymerase sigma-70 factor (family 1)
MSSNGRFIGNKQEFKKVFDAFYPSLCAFASRFTGDAIISEDIVQEVFLSLWERSENFTNEYAIKSFLYTSVRNRCLNYLEHIKVMQKHRDLALYETDFSPETNHNIIEEETHRLIYHAINELPSQCRNILLLSMKGLKNHEIADELKISENTVKTQKKIAYKQLRVSLKDIYPLVAFLIKFDLLVR